MMTPENDQVQGKSVLRFSSAFDALAQISDFVKSWLDSDTEETTRLLLTDGMQLFDQATENFIKENEPTMAAWTTLQKASLMADLACSADPVTRSDLARQALELAGDGFQLIPADPPPNLKATTRLYSSVFETLFKIRALLDNPEEVKALDTLIQGFSAHFGEVQACNMSIRSKACDLLFTAQVLETLVDIEKDPMLREQMLEVSKGLGLQAHQQLQTSTAVELTPVTTWLHELEYKLKPETITDGILCTLCGAKNLPGRSVCSQCGNYLKEEDR